MDKVEASFTSAQKVIDKVEFSFASVQNKIVELSLYSNHTYRDPFRDVELDVVFWNQDGTELRVPAFWAGENTWKARFSSPEPGEFEFTTICNDTQNAELHGRSGTIEIKPYTGRNPLYCHGPVRIAADLRHFEHADGTPFFWLADTWWGGLCKRFTWPEDFMLLTDDRVKKGFTVVQIVAGFPPIMAAWDPRAENEAGYAWEEGFSTINPDFYNEADLRIQHLVDRGISPCIFGTWGYIILDMGVENMKLHWRNIVARWGAYPVTWSLCGESNLPWYCTDQREEDKAVAITGWTEVGRYVQEIDGFNRPTTIHVTPNPTSGRKGVNDDSVLDFDMLQTGHVAYAHIPDMINSIRDSVARDDPPMPVLNGEPTYEGVFGSGWHTYQRFQFWACFLSGTVAGYTYGAAGIWEVNTEEIQAGIAPHGTNWGITPWREAFQLPGSRHVGISKELVTRYPWWRIEPHQEWAYPHWDQDTCPKTFAGGIPGELRIIYTPNLWNPQLFVKQLEDGLEYDAYLVNPLNGDVYSVGKAAGNEDGDWRVPQAPIVHDWIVILEAKDFDSGLKEAAVKWKPPVYPYK